MLLFYLAWVGMCMQGYKLLRENNAKKHILQVSFKAFENFHLLQSEFPSLGSASSTFCTNRSSSSVINCTILVEPSCTSSSTTKQQASIKKKKSISAHNTFSLYFWHSFQQFYHATSRKSKKGLLPQSCKNFNRCFPSQFHYAIQIVTRLRKRSFNTQVLLQLGNLLFGLKSCQCLCNMLKPLKEYHSAVTLQVFSKIQQKALNGKIENIQLTLDKQLAQVKLHATENIKPSSESFQHILKVKKICIYK